MEEKRDRENWRKRFASGIKLELCGCLVAG